MAKNMQSLLTGFEMIRKAAVAGYFYPGSREGIDRQIRGFPLGEFSREDVVGLLAPHAGYKYSGRVAAMVYARAKVSGPVIYIGPNHGAGRGAAAPKIAMMAKGTWKYPGGMTQIDSRLATLLLESSCQIADAGWAHEEEHSLEVQIPMLEHFSPDTQIVPIIISRIDDGEVMELAECIYQGIVKYGGPVTLAASTDMSHYVPQEMAEKLDRMAIERIEALDAEGLLKTVRANRISMCGAQPTAVVVEVCRKLGAKQAHLVEYTTSGEVSGDYSSVVGYSGFTISRPGAE
ncbi:MAG: AmmeMemoRadiSam system protein B [Nitrospinota bacterium]|nr:AmmeMemoRadiSam system protein B [Nitrospinota bacterium]